MSDSRSSRREFLKTAALAAAAVTLGARGARGEPIPSPRSNSFPGRIVIYRDPAMNGHLSVINRNRVEQVLHQSVRVLTGIDDTGPAFASLLPGLTSTSKIAVKVNCIGPTDTRWETARAVVSGLSLMLGGAYDVSNVTVFDNQNIFGHGYTASEFTFNGHAAVLSSNNSPSSYYVYPGYRLSNYIVNSQFVIDVPALKSHSDTNNQITIALKNHYGSCSPSSLCGNITGMLTVNADAHIKGKTSLVVLDALRGTYTGGPDGAPQSWSLYPEHSPNTLAVSTDPVTNDYWARDAINDERLTHGYAVKPCPWVEQASGSPYNLGVSDPGQMTVINLEGGGVEEGPVAAHGLFLSPPFPNPFRDATTLRFSLPRAAEASVAVFAADGKLVRRIRAGNLGAGEHTFAWDGRDERGSQAAAGMYFVRVEAGGSVQSRRLICAR